MERLAIYASDIRKGVALEAEHITIVMDDSIQDNLSVYGKQVIMLPVLSGGLCLMNTDLHVTCEYFDVRGRLYVNFLDVNGTNTVVHGHLNVNEGMHINGSLRASKGMTTRGNITVTDKLTVKQPWYYNEMNMPDVSMSRLVTDWVLPHNHTRPYWIERFASMDIDVDISRGCYVNIVTRLREYGIERILDRVGWTPTERWILESYTHYHLPDERTGDD